MPSRTHQTAVVIIPPESVWPPIQAIRRVHDRQFRRWMPHITLIYPFRERETFPQLAGEFARVLEGMPPFSFHLNRFRYFSHGRGRFTLWLAPEPAQPIIELQARLQAVVPDCADVRRHSGGFTPHLSVGQVRGKAQLHRLLSELSGKWAPLVVPVEAIYLIWRNPPPDDVFRVGETVRLGMPLPEQD